MKLLNDEPTLEDLLDRAPLVQQFAAAVAGCEPPQVFGLHGDWGSGKTSFLCQLQWHLVGACPHVESTRGALAELKKGRYKDKTTVVWFEAWRYQYEQAPIVALLHEIRSQLPWTSKTLNTVKKLTAVSARSALLSLEDLTKRIGIQASKIQEVGEKWEADHLATQLPSHQIRHHLEHTLTALLPNQKGHRLVIIIDDLDRCEAETAYQLLEGIKIYLNLPNCVFILGMNQRILEGAVGRHLPDQVKDDKERRRMAKRYLEKLCQNVWHLPLVEKRSSLLSRYLKQPRESERAGQRRRALVHAVQANGDWLPPVPRKIKGFANLLLRSEAYLDACRPEPEPNDNRWAEVALVFCYLYHFHHELYRVLSHRPEFYEELLSWCRADRQTETRADSVMTELGLTHVDERRLMDDTDPSETAPEIYDPVYFDPATDRILHVEELIRKLGSLTTTELKDGLLESGIEGASGA